MGKTLIIKNADFSKNSIEKVAEHIFINGYINGSGAFVTTKNYTPDIAYGYIPKYVTTAKDENNFLHYSEFSKIVVSAGFEVRFTVTKNSNFGDNYTLTNYIRASDKITTQYETVYSIDDIYNLLSVNKDEYPYIATAICYANKIENIPANIAPYIVKIIL